MTLPEGALVAPAAARNREPILAILRQSLPASGMVLEIASGSGEHAIHFAEALPGLTWQPSDRDREARRSIDVYREVARLPNLLPAIELDAAAANWPLVRADAIVAINMVHIAPWSATLGLMGGAGRLLGPGGVLFLYGPFREGGRHTAPSNADFDTSLRARNVEWGVRDIEEVSACAAANELDLTERVEMPANNLSLVLRKR